jgi:hypothetical protein
MFTSISLKSNIDDSKVRFRCRCRTEWSPMESRTCPACGTKVPVAIALDGATWKPMRQHKLETLRESLQSDDLNALPAVQRAQVRKAIEGEIAALESGGAAP